MPVRKDVKPWTARKVTRRAFIKGGIVSIAGGHIVGIPTAIDASSQTESTITEEGVLPRTRLGRTNLNVSIVGFGGAALFYGPRGRVPQKEMLETSLRRLQTDHIEIYGLHALELTEDLADRFIEKHLPDLVKAKEEGKISHIGATANKVPA